MKGTHNTTRVGSLRTKGTLPFVPFSGPSPAQVQLSGQTRHTRPGHENSLHEPVVCTPNDALRLRTHSGRLSHTSGEKEQGFDHCPRASSSTSQGGDTAIVLFSVTDIIWPEHNDTALAQSPRCIVLWTELPHQQPSVITQHPHVLLSHNGVRMSMLICNGICR